jgi:hypothetical protein
VALGCPLCAIAREHGGSCPQHSPGSREWPPEPGDDAETRALPGTLSADEAEYEVEFLRVAGELIEIEHRWDG